MVLERLATELAVGRGVLTLNDGTDLRRASHSVGVTRSLTLSRWRSTHARCGWRYTRRLGTVVGVGDTVWGSRSLLLREGLRKLRRSLSLGCWRVGARSRGIVKHLRGGREASVSRWRWTLRLVLVLSGLLLGRGRLARRHVLSKAVPRIVWVQHLLRLSTRVLGILEVGETVVTRPVGAWGRLLSSLSLARGRSPPLRSRRASTQSTGLVCLGRHILREGCACLVGQTVGRLTLEQRKTSFDVHVGRIKLGSSGVGIESVVGLVVARLIQGTEIVPHL